MVEILVIGGLGMVALAALFFLVALPFLLLGLVLKAVFALLLLPFRLLGLVLGAVGSVLAFLFKGLFGILAVVIGIAVLAVGLALLPLGLVLLAVLAAAGLFKLLAGATLGAAA